MLLEGWTSTPVEYERLTRAEVVEHERYWAEMVLKARSLRRKYDRAVWLKDIKRAESLAEALRSLGPSMLYAHGRWERHGRWNRYYQVRGGAVHTTLTCRCINGETVLNPLPQFAGRSRQFIADRYKLCRHCGDTHTGDIPADRAYRSFKAYLLIT